MIKKHGLIKIGIICAFVLISVIALAATLYPYAMVSFSGIQMVKNNSTTQGFVDITLKNINTTGLSFCLNYDKNYIELSNVEDNVPIMNSTSSDLTGNNFNIEHKYFEQNTDAFPIGSFQDIQSSAVVGVNMPIIGIADADTGHVIMNFLPKENVTNPSEYIQHDPDNDNRLTIMANSSEGVKLGRVSFRIKDPAAFSKLTPEQLENVIKIVPFSEMISVEGDESIADDQGIHISYIDENGDVAWYSRNDKNIDYEFKIDIDISDVKPQVEEITVSSYEIYKYGTVKDLLEFINEKMSLITLQYADNSQVPAAFEWNEMDSNISSIMWDPKGGDYTVTQPYNESFDVSVTVHVTPITIIDFDVEKEDVTYYTGDPDFPTQFSDLELPSEARPVLDTYIPNGGLPKVEIEWYYLDGTDYQATELPDNFSDGGVFKYIGNISAATDMAIRENNPWLTIDELPVIDTTRRVVTSEDEMPKTLVVTSAETNMNGILSVTVEYSDGSSFTDGTVFHIKMPGGEKVNTDLMDTRYTAILNGTTATITLEPNPEASSNEMKLSQCVNLGNRAGSFSIASQEQNKSIGNYTQFTFEPRRNIYVGPDYVFDYSESLSAMFPVKAGTELPTTVTLPVSTDRIATTYSGYNGTMPGQLQTFTVDSWTTVSGDPALVGSVVEIVGTLANTSYTNYGQVFNDDNVTVTIKYLVVKNDSEDTINTIDDFVYDRQQVGYDYDDLQTHTFTIKNSGTSDIYGLSAVISLSDISQKEVFVVTKAPIGILYSGKSTDLDITTKIGLDVGTYVCTVSIMSNNKVLETFKITFEVVEEPIYKITIQTNDINFGTAKTQTETYTAMADEVITIIAESKEDCEFVEWTCDNDDVIFDDPLLATTTFTMPASDVKITANFKETLGAKLRATELYVKDAADNDQQLNDENWKKIEFDPITREYYVSVENDIETVKLWFKPRTEAENATFTLTHEHNTMIDDLEAPIQDMDDGYYKTQDISLEVSPVENIVTLSFTYDDPSDNPDEGEVTRSYQIHIYRKLKKSDLITFAYGNSPYGLIMRDDNIVDKDTAKQDFINNEFSFSSGSVPVGGTQLKYINKAWNGANYDLDDVALFVVNKDAFIDPGYTDIKNSIGGTVDTSSITKKVTVNLLAETDASMQNGSSNDFVYIQQSEISLPVSGEITQLMNERIRPDIYEITYSFIDFDGTIASVSKPLIILSSIGDVNIDKVVDSEDVSRVLHRFSIDLANDNNVPDYISGGLINKYRICDANNDGIVNALDANSIRKGISDSFYTNLSEGGGA